VYREHFAEPSRSHRTASISQQRGPLRFSSANCIWRSRLPRPCCHPQHAQPLRAALEAACSEHHLEPNRNRVARTKMRWTYLTAEGFQARGAAHRASRRSPRIGATPPARPPAATRSSRPTASSEPCASPSALHRAPSQRVSSDVAKPLPRYGGTRATMEKSAEEKGFEPLVGLPPRRFSKPWAV
jgi:hypothetical protein